MASVVARNRRETETEDELREEGDSDNVTLLKDKVEEVAKPLLDDAEKKAHTPQTEVQATAGAKQLAFCFIGLQASYLTWGYVQEKVMTREYATGKFPSATFCVFSNRVLAVLIAMLATLYQHGGKLCISAPYYAFAPCALSNSLSSFGQYQALRYVSFPLQTISKSTKVIPVMLMGKLLNKKTYPVVDYVEALAISVGVSIFSLAGASGGSSSSSETVDAGVAFLGLCMLALYVVSDSFTSQWQSKLYQAHPTVDQFQMMFAVNSWAITMTLFALVTSGELVLTLKFLTLNPVAGLDNLTIAVTSATGQLFIFYTIKTFGPVVFTIIMTTRQVFSIVISCIVFGHSIPLPSFVGALAVFGAIFHRIKRQASNHRNKSAQKAIPTTDKLLSGSGPGADKVSISNGVETSSEPTTAGGASSSSSGGPNAA
eukprot:CAMPEP_0198657002 /NCGR_PEP_ID=MMETSP1467-20131203/11246_1 /TAXON_ID=1462469 /ORGANISM="unid. sp., Strain CCMP2135" /LENGTH=428 /DNA_ID=CAMNT_0044393089 /DNA_START=100 /DNA_END=1386 /DNA_ORIENTATION=-